MGLGCSTQLGQGGWGTRRLLPLLKAKSWSSYTPRIGRGHTLVSEPGGGPVIRPLPVVVEWPGHMSSRNALYPGCWLICASNFMRAFSRSPAAHWYGGLCSQSAEQSQPG